MKTQKNFRLDETSQKILKDLTSRYDRSETDLIESALRLLAYVDEESQKDRADQERLLPSSLKWMFI